MTTQSPVLCPPGSHFVIIDEGTWVCVPDVHEIPVAPTWSLVGLAIVILWTAIKRKSS